MRARTTAAAVLAATILLAGCADTVNGSGTQAGGATASGPSATASAPVASSAAPTSPDFPTPSITSASAPPSASGSGGGSDLTKSNTSCPRPYYAPAQLRFTCITSGMTAETDEVWPLLEVKRVDSSGWALQQGAARYSGSAGASLPSIALAVRKLMIDEGAYLDSPKVVTLHQQSGKFGTRNAVIITSQITLNPAAAKKRGTKVRVERLWILAVQTSPSIVSLWHASLPDLAKSLWPKVPAAIKTVQVST